MRPEEQVDRLLSDVQQASRQAGEQLLAPLLFYDAKHGGDLIHTLQVYFAHHGNASKTADSLHLHRSGLLYRLRRIEELMHVRLEDHHTRLALEVALLGTDQMDGITRPE